MKPRILVVDDEASIRNMLAFSLNRADMDVDVASDGDDALEQLQGKLQNEKLHDDPLPDLIVLDWMMPRLDGLQFTRTLRKSPDLKDIPIIMLTAKGNETDRTSGLDSGADDYMVKPFSTRELISRVRAVLRRTQQLAPPEAHDSLRVGELTIDMQSHRALAGDRPLSMGPTEFRLLKLFMRNPGRAWSRSQLLTEIWGDNQAVEERTVDVHIRRLRKSLQQTGHEEYVQPVRGHGYRFSDVI